MIDDTETKKEHKIVAAATQVKEDNVDKLLKSFSSWFRLKKAVAWVRRFTKWLKQGKPQTGFKGAITQAEMYEAEGVIIGYVQGKSYGDEIKALKQGNKVPKSSLILKLEPFLDKKGHLRCGGRLRLAPVSEEVKHPVIIPRQHDIARLIVRDAHGRTGHSGREYTLATIRQSYWITRARPLVREMIRKCLTCNRYRGTAASQRMADLPEDRITPGKPAFSYVGVDCFGPFLVKRGRSQEKRYGCLFTCMVTRAVHIEKLDSLETDSFINGLTRFMARRGVPEKIRCDNGSNFVGAHRELRQEISKLHQSSKVTDTLLQRNIKWTFNPPYASHMGGVWERQIRTVRKVMTIMIKNQVLHDEMLATIFCEAESIVNGRPLTPVSDDPTDFEPLTPNHLLLLRPGNDGRLTATTTKTDMYSKRWKHVQYIADKFWARYLKEYLPLLQIRSKWCAEKTNLKVGDLVLIMELNAPRYCWPLARVTEVFKGKDELVRTVKLKTASSELTRPVTKLCVLEGLREVQ